jgi:outer membrane protein TolC
MAHLETKPDLGAHPTIPPVNTPTTILDPEREIRYLSLSEAIALAMEQGREGNFGISNSVGTFPVETYLNDSLNLTNVLAGFGSRSIRVFSLDPAVTGTQIELALSKFDAVYGASMTWRNTDRPVGTSLESFQAGGAGINAIEQAEARFATGIVKPLHTGGVAGITFATDYTYTNLPARVNPSYRPQLQFVFEQPLLQGFGTEINQIRAAHPGVLLSPVGDIATLNRQPHQFGIVVARLDFDIQRAEFERRVHNLVSAVEKSYWSLYNAYWTLYAQEKGLMGALDVWRNANARKEGGGAGGYVVGDAEQVLGRYHEFRANRMAALHALLQAERELRGLLGLPMEDGTRLVPCDSPTLAPIHPDWDIALQEAMTLKPDLYQARQDVKRAQMAVIDQKNSLLPDLRFFATYDSNSVGGELDGPSGNNAFRNLSSNHHNSWQLGLRLNVPIGFRQAHANVRVAQLQLARSYRTLQDVEQLVESVLTKAYRQVFANYELIKALRSQRLAFGEQYQLLYARYKGGFRDTPLNVLLDAQQRWVDALRREYDAIVDYNHSLVDFEWTKGTILQRNNIAISEGPLPSCVQKRAVEHLRERNAALELRQRPAPTCDVASAPPASLEAPLTPHEVRTLPELMNKTPFLGDAPQALPRHLPSESPAPKLPTYLPPEKVTPTELPTLAPVSGKTTNFADPTAHPVPTKQKPLARTSEFGKLREQPTSAPSSQPTTSVPPLLSPQGSSEVLPPIQ